MQKTAKRTASKKSASEILSPLRVGNNVLIRTVTFFHIGEVVKLDAIEVVLKGASWVADTDRWNAALKTGKLREVEPFADGICSVGRGTIIDVANWSHALPMAVL